MGLYDLVQYAKNLTDSLIQGEGELTPELELELANIDKELMTKVDSYKYVLERLDLEAKYWKDKADQYLRVSKSCKNLQDRMKERIKEAMDILEASEVEGNDFKFKLIKQGEKVEVLDENFIPVKFMKEEITYKLDKKALLKELKNGEKIEGCEIKPIVSLRSYPRKDV